ncbi:hypothetical protein DES40_1307 [Litorimonas taeanensis]|uniref:Lipoprotein n=1 Tax=Litorimonas taeanensis TaxID=568099 RepID=A0A420WLP6_9PROT|nr:hypothetical protein [Litorimonas taeanensis]RKQ71971.1 hypothetical protein DES40_1307 [Litorimonas taeanensis]
MRAVLLLSTLMTTACLQTEPETLPTLYIDDTSITAQSVIESAYDKAGGAFWVRPLSLSMEGYAVFYKDGVATLNERHSMWRVYDAAKMNAHQVDGMVRIESIRDGKPVINISFDGETTYTDAGPLPQSTSNKQWSSSFGFGVIRHALDDGYTMKRLADDLIDGRKAYIVEITDPSNGKTLFGISQDNYSILKVGFDTNKGWHERIYSNFFSNSDDEWVQPGRVRLYYNGIKSNEVIWTKYSVNDVLDTCLFKLPEETDCRQR